MQRCWIYTKKSNNILCRGMAFSTTFSVITVSIVIFLSIVLECVVSLKTNQAISEETNKSIGKEVFATSTPLETLGSVAEKSKSEAAIAVIRREANLSTVSGASLVAVKAIEEGLKAAVKLFAASSDAAEEALMSAREKSCDKPEAAVKVIQKGMKTALQLIYAAEFTVYYSFDAGGVITGDLARKRIKSGLKLVQEAGTYAVASLDAAEVLATQGLKTNLAAATKGIDAAEEATFAGYEAIFASIVNAGKSVFKGLSDDAAGLSEKDGQNCKRATARSAEATAAENQIIFIAERAIKSESQVSVSNAISKMIAGLICGIDAIAAGEAAALRTLSIATELASIEPKLAVATFKAGTKAVKKGIITGGNEASQGMDAVANILGNQKTKQIVTAILKIQHGINSTIAVIDNAVKLASIGSEFDEHVTEMVLRAGYKSISAVLFVFYSLFVTIAEEAL